MDRIIIIFMTFNEGTVRVIIALPTILFQSVFRVKYIVRHVIKGCKVGVPYFSCQSLFYFNAYTLCVHTYIFSICTHIYVLVPGNIPVFSNIVRISKISYR